VDTQSYFNNWTYGDISIEQLAGQLNNYIATLHYTDGTPINQVDLVVHSMGGLIATSLASFSYTIGGSALASPPLLRDAPKLCGKRVPVGG
jgi:hypothetical protein